MSRNSAAVAGRLLAGALADAVGHPGARDKANDRLKRGNEVVAVPHPELPLLTAEQVRETLERVRR